jgi:hypothetical protein
MHSKLVIHLLKHIQDVLIHIRVIAKDCSYTYIHIRIHTTICKHIWTDKDIDAE